MKISYMNSKRFKLLKTFLLVFLSISFIIRLSFTFWVLEEINSSIIGSFLIGFLYDVGTIAFFTIPYTLYLLLLPNRFVGSIFDKILTYFAYTVGVLIFLFSFFAEITFWDEFKRRFNFIAVDYLIYTYEVVANINESYPLPILISVMLVLVLGITFITYKKNVFKDTFDSIAPRKQKWMLFFANVFVVLLFTFFIKNKDAEWSQNRYVNEISKAGIYSFFSAFRNNEIDYQEFYATLPEKEVKKSIESILKIQHPEKEKLSIRRKIDNGGEELKSNVIFICIESLSASFLERFGNEEHITPTLDSLTREGIFFSNLLATGTRTVRGMEAITLSIPPTPGRSIVKRPDNRGLFTIGEVFKQKGYQRNFFYGGDGYFDNMNQFFGGNGFNIYDRGRGFLLGDDIQTIRTNIDDDEVTFENAWGVCDEDIYKKVIKQADESFQKEEPFFDFVMTTSNHKPYTYPENAIDIPSGTGRDGAVKYTDYAIKQFLKEIKNKPWYQNTVIVIMSDHCASSAGKWELDVENYHIPAMILNLPESSSKEVHKLCSQIDLFPTLFGLLHWSYETNLYGQDIMKMKKSEERALGGNYRKLGLLKSNHDLVVLNDKKEINYFKWNEKDNSLEPAEVNTNLGNEIIDYYQSASELYKKGGLKVNYR
ncbi:phosphatidylglycerol--membrane-oligosaccharide glycerophosphotransferase [Flavobacteriaceae bacterium UJ101]|nr:phosphatidylglycerol--membrane-oligosaccharide glycerophosphotransferase [Flavobacteriaceae bacterium UJ101]